MGLHNSGTSMVARLLMLAGVWAGRPDQLSIGKRNKLKWWERKDVFALNDNLTKTHTDATHPTWIGAGFDPKLVLPEERARFKAAASEIIEDMDQYCPWLIKDPRLAYIGSMWMELMAAPVCIVVYRHPARIALRLAQHWYKGPVARLDPASARSTTRRCPRWRRLACWRCSGRQTRSSRSTLSATTARSTRWRTWRGSRGPFSRTR
ncbi:MAG: hypothetical protein J3K34DRAFT_77771 [Monoraphidium minutum]|nr:MAG: hypothetical protein J3K34DRAFT_77771 [Monoraphidium minutum]